ncbi:MAG: hypothetical protein LC747_06135 [Acidobacteria bacterium]|nr:hypothetical protein [Acidobacteriota bacterium]
MVTSEGTTERHQQMSAPSGQFTLYYSLPSFPSTEKISREERFDDIVDALASAWLVSQGGGNTTHLIYDNATLFYGDDLNQVLSSISARGAQPGVLPTEIVRPMLPELLSKQLAKTVHFAHEHFGAVTVYRKLLEELYEAADQAIQKKDLGLLHQITGKLAFWYVPSEHDVKQWGRDFLYAYRRDAGWLRDTKKALEDIQAAVKDLEVTEGSHNAELKAQILEAAERGLITHV